MRIKKLNSTVTWLMLFLLTTATALAQTTSFTYQGRLVDGGTPANGLYEIQFTLWDATAGGTQQPQPAPVIITRANVQVSAGSFSVQPLDFGVVAFPGADRYLEISVRRTAVDPFTTLSPRQQITSTPYAIRSVTAATADTATTATQLGGVVAARFVQSDAGGSVNIAGGLTVGGSFSLNTVNAQTQYNLRGIRILSDGGGSDLFAGVNAGRNNTTGLSNTFVGASAGSANTVGDSNSFFGGATGALNTTGNNNAFFGSLSGPSNTTGTGNSFFGTFAGFTNTTGSGNTLIGASAGVGMPNLTNAIAIGASAFVSASNSMVLGGINGVNGATADTNVGIGTTSPQTRLQVQTATGFYGFTHTDGAIAVGSYVGAGSSGAFGGWLGTQSNHKLFFFTGNGQPTMTVDTTGNVGIGTSTPASRLTVTGLIETTAGGVKFPDGTIQTSAAGGGAGSGVTSLNGLTNNVTLAAGSNITITPVGNTLAIASTNGSGILNQTTLQAGANFNISGTGTANVLDSATHYYLQGQRFMSTNSELANTLVGLGAGENIANDLISARTNNSFFGYNAGLKNANKLNSFFGGSAGVNNVSGSANVFVGYGAGFSNASGESNTFIGTLAGLGNTNEAENTAIGYSSSGAAGVTNATSIGARAQVTQSNSLVLGSINGFNGATANTNVGIGTSAPKAKLEVTGGNIFIGSSGQGLILKSPDGTTCKLLSLDNAGAMVLSAIACP